MNFSMKRVSMGVMAAAALLGCAAQQDESAAPQIDDDGVEVQQAVTYNGFTINAQTPVGSNYVYMPYLGWTADVTTSVVISGGSGTQKMGVCLEWRRIAQTSPYGPIPCTTTANCPAVATSGGAMYCAAPQNSGQKYCYERWGGQTTSCAGSPAMGGAAVGNGTYSKTVNIPTGSTMNFISYACVNGCTGGTPTPSVSSAATL